MSDGDHWVDSAGLCAVVAHPAASQLVGDGVAAMRHRGAVPSAAVLDDGRVRGFAAGVERPSGAIAVGATTRGVPGLYLGRARGAELVVAVAGRVQNSGSLWRDLESRGAVSTRGDDAELLAHLLAQSTQRTFVNRLVDALWRMEGSFTVVLAAEGRLVAVRDPRGFRPLGFGRIGGASLVASERSAVEAMGGEWIRELDPGEMLIVDAGVTRSVAPFARRGRTACIQELLALTPVSSAVFGSSAYAVRVALGERLGRDFPVARLQTVVPLGASAMAVSAGFSRVARAPLDPVLEATGTERGSPEAVGFGWAAARAAVEERRVGLVATSMVSGRSVRAAVAALREAGAREVHVRVASPPVRAACVYGVTAPGVDAIPALDMADRVALAARIGADSIEFLPRDTVQAVLAETAESGGWCEGCLTGEYPVPPEVEGQLPLFAGGASDVRP